MITSKMWLHQSGSKNKSVNEINTGLDLVDTNKDKKMQNIKTPNVQIYTKETKQSIKK